ncbi:MAG TPA: mechanosensitive ion channel domain-containing protein [Sphingomicrobium sp.]|nr:mechanosensitive ion channel domain-containing protein [Sphingomicrobium sp.]
MNTAQNAASGSSATAPVHGAHLFGITLIGATSDNLHKLLLTAGFLVVGWLVSRALRAILELFIGSRSGTRFQFWAKQGVSLVIAAILILGVMSIWFDNPARLAGVVGLIGAGIAFALQRVITAVAGYFVILRGKTFNVGDRIMMGGVRGDVIDLSFMQTQIMEMGQSPKEQGDAPSMWVRSRQFTGRIVTVTNDKVFDEPVYNYSHDFPYIWDEINLPVRYEDDRAKAEAILLEAARRHAVTRAKIGDEEVKRLEENFGIKVGDIDPQTFWRITDNWLEITVRFLAPDHGIRRMKDEMSRDILEGLDKANMGIASGTYAIVQVPPIKIEGVQPRQ